MSAADGSEPPLAALVTFFRNVFAKSKQEASVTLEELATRIRAIRVKDKGSQPLLSFARYGEKRTKENSRRSNDNVTEISGGVGDYDGETIPFEEAVARVRTAGLMAILYTSASHTDLKPRWRVVCPARRLWTPERYAQFIARINGVFDGALNGESFTLSQPYYYGNIIGRPPCKIEVVEGEPIDERDDLDATAIYKRSKENDAEESDHPRGRGFEAHLASMGDGEGLEGFNSPLCRAAAAYAVMHGADFDKATLKAKLIEAINSAPKKPERNNIKSHYLTDAYLDRVIESAIEKYSDTRSREFAKDNKLSDDDLAFVAAQAALGTVDYEKARKGAAKQMGIGVGALDKLVKEYREAEKPDEAAKPTQADVLLEIADTAQLFHNAEGIAYADITVNNHRETWPVASKGFKDWLTREYYRKTHAAVGGYGMEAARELIEAKARFDAPTQEVFLRTARIGDKIYLDLCDDAWRAVEIDKDGWRIVAAPVARFRRARGMLPLPAPEKGGSVNDLRPFINMPAPKRTIDPDTGKETVVDDDFVLVVGWLLGALSGVGPYAVLALGGLHGSAKTFTGRVLRETVDPNKVSLRALPRHDHDLYIAGGNALILAFDNISTLPNWLSDTLCRLSTGGGFAARELYTDADEKLFDGMRPLMLNGIENFVTRPDLGDRTIMIMLEEIADENRRTEAKLWSQFEAVRPKILGALLDAVAHGLGTPADASAALPRMADFAVWVAACEGALWAPGTFARAYAANRQSGQIEMLDTDAVAMAMQKFARRPPMTPEDAKDIKTYTDRIKAGGVMWEGTASRLLDCLNADGSDVYASDETRRDHRWPRTPRQLGGRLRRMTKSLRLVGVEIAFDRGHNSKVSVTRKPAADVD